MFSVLFFFSGLSKKKIFVAEFFKMDLTFMAFRVNLVLWLFACRAQKSEGSCKKLSEFTTLVAVARPSWNRRPGWASWRILVNAASNDGWSVDLNCFCDYFVCCYCCGDVKCWGRTVEADLKCRRWSSRRQERLSACDRRHDSAEFVADCDRTPCAIDSFLLAHLARHK